MAKASQRLCDFDRDVEDVVDIVAALFLILQNAVAISANGGGNVPLVSK
ncbi:MAG TPA: hypothetical protein VH143_09680 [Kofleriaceae bacterium]|nr:hypothetical protein [Kofleriaceae bacterium]